MSPRVCPKCHYEQEESPECQRCGLIFARYHDGDPPALPEPPRGRRWFRTLRIVLLLVTILLLALLLWPDRALPSEPDPQAPARVARKLAELQQDIQKGEPHQLHLDEWEVNSWLDENLTRAMVQTQARVEEEWSSRGAVQGLAVSFVEDRVQIHLQFEVLTKDLSLTLWGRLLTVDGYLRLEVDSGKMGQLPLPRSVLQRAMKNVFDDPANAEKFRLPPGIDAIRIEGGELWVDYLADASGERL